MSHLVVISAMPLALSLHAVAWQVQFS